MTDRQTEAITWPLVLTVIICQTLGSPKLELTFGQCFLNDDVSFHAESLYHYSSMVLCIAAMHCIVQYGMVCLVSLYFTVQVHGPLKLLKEHPKSSESLLNALR